MKTKLSDWKYLKFVIPAIILLLLLLYYVFVKTGAGEGSSVFNAGRPVSRNNNANPGGEGNNSSDYYVRETLSYLSRSDYENASATIEKGCSLFPASPQLLELKGRIAYQEGRLKEASEILEKVIKDNPDYAPAYNSLALVSIENGKPADGLPLVETAINIAPDDVSYRVTRAKILEHTGKTGEAEDEYRKIVAENPEKYLVYKDWALLHYDMGDRKKAIEILEKCVSKCKDKEDLAEIYTVKMDSTIDLLDYIEDDNTEETAKTIDYVVKSVEEDVKKMKEAGLLRPVVYSTLDNMYHTVALHCPQKRDDFNKKAREYARKYIGESPPPATPDKFHIMGDAYQYLGEYDKAMECYKKAMVGDYARSVYINVAEVYIAQKNYPAAREYLNKIISRKGEHYDKREARIMLKKIKGKV